MNINLKIYILDYLPISEKEEAFRNTDMLIKSSSTVHIKIN
jgi:hypothetical protein